MILMRSLRPCYHCDQSGHFFRLWAKLAIFVWGGGWGNSSTR